MVLFFSEPQKETLVYAKVNGHLQKFKVDTGDLHEARHAVIDHMERNFIQCGAVLALVN